MEMVKDALDQLRGAVMIVYPMGLPPYDPIRMEFENKEDLSGTQMPLFWMWRVAAYTAFRFAIQNRVLNSGVAPDSVVLMGEGFGPHTKEAVDTAGLSVIKESEAQLWWAAKELRRTKKLSDYVGKNEKTKIITKIQQRGHGAPAREPIISSEEQKQLMLYYHRRQEELKVGGAGGLSAELMPRHSLHALPGAGEQRRALQGAGRSLSRASVCRVVRVMPGVPQP
ncbi:hypothetical protein P7K49_032211 [Saguinus oedipus]|uniref:Uncharacterized protein n=1 Tax=Saguinus oedipus TaxID=9490 RepID=A0ABQ9TYI1_SAGOE|nr:hypothetical protein P7K49_032211 [Saguinus oedipus]